jgi:phosphomannomutase
VHVVREQAAPDPDFPTVRFPNPEEPGAADALLALAAAVGADLAVALDPDADRCALGVPVPGAGWRMLTGDETGSLLGEHILSTTEHDDPLVASTVVSSSLLRAIAARHGARYAETLTGFKNITRAGPGLVYGYEEALGYCVDPDAVRDKDGISAAVLACDLAATLKVGGRTLLDALDDLAVAHGVHRTEGLALRMDPGERLDVLNRLGAELASTLDFEPTVERPAPDVLVLRAADQRVVIRPSGTEPKLKTYLEVVEPVVDRTELAAARSRAAERIAVLRVQLEELLSGAAR